MTKKQRIFFIKTITGMVLAVLFPWIAGFLSALADLNGPFFMQIAFSRSVVCLLISFPLCLGLLYIMYHSYTGYHSNSMQSTSCSTGEKSA